MTVNCRLTAVLQAPRGGPPVWRQLPQDVWRQLPQEVLRVARQQVAWLSPSDADKLRAAKEVQAAAERCIRAIHRAQQLS